MKLMNASVILALLVVTSVFNKANATEKKPITAEAAIQAAMTCIDEKRIDASQHEMTKPESIQKIQIGKRKGWRVSWKLKLKEGELAVKGGQIVVVVYEDGTCVPGWGE